MYHAAIIAKLKLIDFDRVSVLGLEYGLNDFTLHVPIGKNADAAKGTFRGALNYSIQRLLTAFPRLNLFLITPAWSLTYEDLEHI
jgi:hypothetical protein